MLKNVLRVIIIIVRRRRHNEFLGLVVQLCHNTVSIFYPSRPLTGSPPESRMYINSSFYPFKEKYFKYFRYKNIVTNMIYHFLRVINLNSNNEYNIHKYNFCVRIIPNHGITSPRNAISFIIT